MSAIADVTIDDTPRRPFFTVQSLAAYLSLSERTVREWIAAGKIPSIRIGGARRIDPVDVDSLLQQLKEESDA